VRATYGTAVDLGGTGSTLTDSIISVDESGTGVQAGDDTIVRDSQISAPSNPALVASSRTTVTGNQIGGCVADPCMLVAGVNNIIVANKVSPIPGQYGDGILISGDHNQVSNNVFMGCAFGPAIAVSGQGNTLRGNSVPSCGGTSVWEAGLRFLRGGNHYGDNIVWALDPFSVGATVQTDLGGNVGFTN
jgi:nitrous oxidase accessory protein NosD